jgi:sulfatase modifying factor 1
LTHPEVSLSPARVSSLVCLAAGIVASTVAIVNCGGRSVSEGVVPNPVPAPASGLAQASIASMSAANKASRAPGDQAKSVLSDIGPSLFSFRSSAPAPTPLGQLLANGDGSKPNGLCPPDMASVGDRFCVDKFEASLVEVMADGSEQPWSPFLPMEGHTVRAVSVKGQFPQGYISEKQAKLACSASGKRLCKAPEWKTACKGPEKTQYPYGNEDQPKVCNDHGKSPIGLRLKQGLQEGEPIEWTWSWDRMNDTALNQYDETLSKTGDHDGCTNGYGVYDMVGNLHEWVDDSAGTFLGGYYQDTHQNGDGCDYKTMAHEAWYHDYSTGFRCCADVPE